MAEDRFNILNETINLYRLQKARVKMDFAMEKTMKKTFPALSNDIRLLKEILEDLQARQDEAATTDLEFRYK